MTVDKELCPGCGHPTIAHYAIEMAPPGGVAVHGVHVGCEECNNREERAEWWKEKAEGIIARYDRLMLQADHWQRALAFIAEPPCDHSGDLRCPHDIARAALAGKEWLSA